MSAYFRRLARRTGLSTAAADAAGAGAAKGPVIAAGMPRAAAMGPGDPLPRPAPDSDTPGTQPLDGTPEFRDGLESASPASPFSGPSGELRNVFDTPGSRAVPGAAGPMDSGAPGSAAAGRPPFDPTPGPALRDPVPRGGHAGHAHPFPDSDSGERGAGFDPPAPETGREGHQAPVSGRLDVTLGADPAPATSRPPTREAIGSGSDASARLRKRADDPPIAHGPDRGSGSPWEHLDSIQAAPRTAAGAITPAGAGSSWRLPDETAVSVAQAAPMPVHVHIGSISVEIRAPAPAPTARPQVQPAAPMPAARRPQAPSPSSSSSTSSAAAFRPSRHFLRG